MLRRIRAPIAVTLGICAVSGCSALWEPEEYQGGSAGSGGSGLDAGGGGTGGGAGSGLGGGTAGCPSGYATCAQSEDCATDLSDDSEHCGACDHSCFGGSCESGQCSAQNLFVFPTSSGDYDFPTFVALHAGALYVVYHGVEGGVWRIDDVAAPSWQAAVKLATGALVDVAPLESGFVTSAVFATIRAEGAHPFDLTTTGGWGLDVSADRLAAASIGQILVFDAPAIVKSLETDGSAVLPTNTIDIGDGVLDVTIAGSEYCYTRNAGIVSVGCTSWAGALGVDPPPYAMTNDGTYVYWTENGPGGIYDYGVRRALIAPLAGPNPPAAERVLSGGLRAHAVVVAEGKLFASLIGQNADRIMMADVSGENPRELTQATRPFGIAVDGTFVYYSSWDGVFRLRR